MHDHKNSCKLRDSPKITKLTAGPLILHLLLSFQAPFPYSPSNLCLPTQDGRLKK